MPSLQAVSRHRPHPVWWRFALASCLLSACAPSLNWRDVTPEDADGLKALFPCKPESFQRAVKWPGLLADVTMHVLTCQAEERTWSLSYMTLPDVVMIGPALQQWVGVMRSNLAAAAKMAASDEAAASHDQGAVVVPHMTPMPQAHAWRFQSQRADGLGRPMALDVQTWHFSHGMRVFQASVAGAADQAKGQSSEDVAQAFFQGFHFPG